MFAERYGYTPDQVGAMTLRQISVFLMPLQMSTNEATDASRRVDAARDKFIAANTG